VSDDPLGPGAPTPMAGTPPPPTGTDPQPPPRPPDNQIPTPAPVDPLDLSDPAEPNSVEPDEPQSRAIDRQIRTILEWVAVAVGALAVALLIKTFLLQAFFIPSGSMETTLTKGDRVLVNKLSYDLHDVNRGDVIVFEKPPGEGGDIEDLIKRVIALPGETVSFLDGRIYVDGLLLEEPYLEPEVHNLPKQPIPNCDNPPSVDTCDVPSGRVFVMGDNREASRDSRFFGPIEEDSIVGRAFLKVWPPSDIGFL
jgi:signal peptidase I